GGRGIGRGGGFRRFRGGRQGGGRFRRGGGFGGRFVPAAGGQRQGQRQGAAPYSPTFHLIPPLPVLPGLLHTGGTLSKSPSHQDRTWTDSLAPSPGGNIRTHTPRCAVRRISPTRSCSRHFPPAVRRLRRRRARQIFRPPACRSRFPHTRSWRRGR